MATPVRVSHNWPNEVAADKLVCRTLHVEESVTGVGSTSGSGTFDNLVVNVSTTLTGPTTSTGPISTSDDISCRNLTASQTVSANALFANATTASTLTVTDIDGVSTINGAVYPPLVVAPGGPVVDIANGDVFPTMDIPAGGTGAYRVTDASLAGMANNDPTIAFITGFDGDISGRTELVLYNASSHMLRFAAPITSIHASRGRIWFPGTRTRATRVDSSSTTWFVEVDDLHFSSTIYDDTSEIENRLVLPVGLLLSAGAIEYSVHGFSDAATDNIVCILTGRATLSIDRNAAPATDPVVVDLPLPIGWDASSTWSAMPGFLPVCGTLDGLRFGQPAGFATPGSITIGAGAVFEDPVAWVRGDARVENPPNGFLRARAGTLGATGNIVTMFVPFRIAFGSYTGVVTF